MTNRFTVMEEWLSEFEKDAANAEEMKEWIYVLIMYLWKGEVVESDNRFVRLAFNNMKNNADRMKAKSEEYKGTGRPSDLPIERIYDMRKSGMTAKDIAEILNSEAIWGHVDAKKVQNSAGWQRVTKEKKMGVTAETPKSNPPTPTTSAPFNF